MGGWRCAALVLLCTVLWGPERVPLEAGVHWEVRVLLCTRYHEPRVVVQTRTYERLRTKEGWEIRPDVPPAPGADPWHQEGWQDAKDVRLYITDTAPEPPE